MSRDAAAPLHGVQVEQVVFVPEHEVIRYGYYDNGTVNFPKQFYRYRMPCRLRVLGQITDRNTLLTSYRHQRAPAPTPQTGFPHDMHTEPLSDPVSEKRQRPYLHCYKLQRRSDDTSSESSSISQSSDPNQSEARSFTVTKPKQAC